MIMKVGERNMERDTAGDNPHQPTLKNWDERSKKIESDTDRMRATGQVQQDQNDSSKEQTQEG